MIPVQLGLCYGGVARRVGFIDVGREGVAYDLSRLHPNSGEERSGNYECESVGEHRWFALE